MWGSCEFGVWWGSCEHGEDNEHEGDRSCEHGGDHVSMVGIM